MEHRCGQKGLSRSSGIAMLGDIVHDQETHVGIQLAASALKALGTPNSSELGRHLKPSV